MMLTIEIIESVKRCFERNEIWIESVEGLFGRNENRIESFKGGFQTNSRRCEICDVAKKKTASYSVNVLYQINGMHDCLFCW